MSNFHKTLQNLKEKPSKPGSVSLLDPSLRPHSQENKPPSGSKKETPRCIPGTSVPLDRRLYQASSSSRCTEGDRLMGTIDERKMEYMRQKMMTGPSRQLSEENNPDEPAPPPDPSAMAYERALADALGAVALPTAGDDANCRILRYKDRHAPSTSRGKEASSLAGVLQTPVATVDSSRYIASVPERVLDAPNVRNDFYLNLLSWSDSNVVAVALEDSVYLWHASTGSITHLMECGDESNPGNDAEEVSCVRACHASSAGGASILATGLTNGTVQLWDMEAKQLLRTMRLSEPSSECRVPAMCWSDHLLVAGSRSGYLHLNDVRIAHHEVRLWSAHSQEICGVEWSPGGTYLATGGNDNVVNLWSMSHIGNSSTNSPELLPTFNITQHTAAIKALAWCPWRENLLATGAGTVDGHLRLFNVTASAASTAQAANAARPPTALDQVPRLKALVSIHTGSQVSGVLWNEDYKELITSHGAPDNQLTLWSYPKLKKIKDLTGHTGRIISISQSPDNESVASLAGDETIRIWRSFKVDDATKKKKEEVRREERNSRMLHGMFAPMR